MQAKMADAKENWMPELLQIVAKINTTFQVHTLGSVWRVDPTTLHLTVLDRCLIHTRPHRSTSGTWVARAG
jgi:hypothetical protein